jgi:hypothetical protein
MAIDFAIRKPTDIGVEGGLIAAIERGFVCDAAEHDAGGKFGPGIIVQCVAFHGNRWVVSAEGKGSRSCPGCRKLPDRGTVGRCDGCRSFQFRGFLRRWRFALAAGDVATSSVLERQAEGQINRLKTLKRAMFGRASVGSCERGCIHSHSSHASTKSDADPV